MKRTDRLKGKGLIRSMNRKGTVYDKTPAVARKRPPFKEPSVCERCGAVYVRQKWRRAGRVTGELLEAASWATCPACSQATTGVGYGRLLIMGEFALGNLDAIRRRIANVERRAGFTQPERRVLSAAVEGSTFEVVTTSQKLAHRIARELEKAFGGRARYHWSDEDGSLLATWRKEARAH
jgi:hypothetical protein